MSQNDVSYESAQSPPQYEVPQSPDADPQSPPALEASLQFVFISSQVVETIPQSLFGPTTAGSISAINTSIEQVPIPSSSPLATQAQQQEEEAKLHDMELNAGEVKKNAFYIETIDIVHKSILNEPTVPEKPSCKLDCCFQAIDWIGCCKRDNMPLHKVNSLTPVLRRARSKGWLIHSNMAFPLTNICGRTVWVGAELFTLFIVLGLSVARFTCGNNNIFNILHLVLSIFATVLGFFDAFVLFCGCPFVRCGAACRKSEQLDVNPDNSTTAMQCQVCCLNATRNAFDVGRMIMSELIFYPLLICAMFEVILSEAYYVDTEANQISFALFVVSATLMVVFVYIVRFAVSVAAICNVNNKRFPPEMKGRFCSKNSTSAICLQGYFVLHEIGQMIVQVVMTISIGILIHAENLHIFEDCTNEESVRISGCLWYMLVAGYILPIFGHINFYFLTYFWSQEFSIGICVDFVNALEQPDIAEILGIENEKEREKIFQIKNHFPNLKEEFNELQNTCCCHKFAYPFQSPVMGIFAFVQILFHAAFFACAIISLFLADSVVSWEFWFLISASVVVFIMNLYAFSIVFVWTIIFAGFIAIISIASAVVLAVIGAIGAIILLLFILAVVCISACGND